MVLSSGKESDFYVDCKQTSLSAAGHLLIGRLLHGLVRAEFPEARAIGGPTIGADPLVSATATVSAERGDPLDAFLIRKEPKGHGTGAPIEGLGNLGPRCPVVVVEDVITTGASTLRSISRCLECELKVLGVVALVDRLEGGRQAIEAEGHRVLALYTRKDFP